MNWITAPSRAFGIGETKSQNAVIKVYSAAELRNALTKVYQLPSGVGTIEIAGDIVITEPIKLRQFNISELQPREIIIQAVAGARIINGRTVENDGGYFYNQTNNTNIPVFDFGKALGNATVPFNPNALSICKYTFKDLMINTPSAKPFGALIAADAYGVGGFISTTAVINTKAYNIWNIYAAYDTTGAIDQVVAGFNNKVDDFKYTTNAGNLITEIGLNNKTFGSFNGTFSNIGIWQLSSYYGSTATQLAIWSNNSFVNNILNSIATGVIINRVLDPITSAPTIGYGNVMIGGTVPNVAFDTGFSFINITPPVGQSSTVTPASAASAANANISNAYITNAASAFLENSQSINATYTQFTNGAGGLIRVDSLPGNAYYEIDWVLAIKYQVSGLVNNYHIKSTVRVDGGGIGTLISNSTIYAFEEVVGTLIGIIPYWDGLNNTFAIAPQDSTPLKIMATCTITLNGLRLPAGGI
jgi:hypothetical protein